MGIIHRAKRTDNGEYIEGHYLKYPDSDGDFVHLIYRSHDFFEVDPKTISMGFIDKNGNKIWNTD